MMYNSTPPPKVRILNRNGMLLCSGVMIITMTLLAIISTNVVTTAFVITTNTIKVPSLSSSSSSSSISSKMMVPSWQHKIPNHNYNHRMMKSMNNDDNEHVGITESTNNKVSTQPTPILLKSLTSSSSSSSVSTNIVQSMTAAIAALTILSSTILIPSLPANAAMSGGRMGGSFSSGGGRSSSSMRMSPSRSYSTGGSSGYYNSYSRPRTTIVAPTIISPISPFYNPFYNPIVPYYGGGGVGAISYSRGPGIFDLLFLGGIGLFLFNAVSNTFTSNNRLSQWDDDTDMGNRNNFFGSGVLAPPTSTTTTTVLKCNVALEVSNRDDPNSILSVLDRIANSSLYKTDTRSGVITLTKQVAMELLRRKSSIYSVAGTISNTNQMKDAQRIYNQWSVQERSKFENENINKFGKFDLSNKNKKQMYDNNDTSNSKATMAIVTLILSVNDSKELSTILKNKTIQSRNDIINVLQTIASLSSDDSDVLNSAEILWTPEDRDEIITKQDMIADYPELHLI